MRKIIAICGVVMLAIFTSVFFAACGNDYKDMYLVIEYLECTETQNGVVGNWKEIDASDGLSFVLDDKYKIDSQNYYSLRCRVTVKGTKKKVDEISVSATGSASLQLSDTKIDENGEFTIKVFTTGSANVFVVPNIQSDKTAVEFPINLYNEVDSISQNPEFYPAVAKGGELKLNELQDVICYFGANGGDTNQAGVAYSIPGVQNVDGVYTLGDTNGSSYFVLNTSNSLNPTISVGTDFDQDEVVLKATSVYSEKTSANKVIDCDISVKIVENIAPTDININFASNYSESENTNRLNKVKEFSLFAQSENFRQSNLVLSGICEDSNYSFLTEELKAQGAIGYSVDIFIDGENINDEGNLEYYHGLKFTDVAIDDTIKANGNILSKQKNKMWTIEATDYILSSINTIKFVIGFENLKFTGKDYNLETSVLQYEIKVNREDLPKAVSINDNPYKDGHVIEKNIYTEYVNGSGLALNVKAVRTLEKQTEILMQTYTNAQDKTYGEFNNLNVYNFNGTPVNFDSNRSSYILNNFSNSVYIKFDNSIGKYAQTVYVDFKVLASPSVFEGVAVADKEYIDITLKLNVVGSLEGVKLTSDVAGNNNNLFAESYKYLEAETTYVSYLSLSANGSASVDTTELTIKSKNSTILFSADNTNWNTVLNCGEIEQNKLYYKGSLTPKGKSDKIIIEAVNGVVFESASIEFVETVGGNSLTLAYANNFIYQAKTTDAYYTENLGTEETPNNKNYAGYYLAIQLGTDADFYFGYGDEFSENYGIYDVTVKNLTVAQLAELGKTLPYYGVGAVEVKEFTNNYSFNIYAQTSNLTCVLEVNVIYFKNSGFLIEKVQDRVYLEIAVYTPVSRLTITPSEANTTNEIYYVNSIINDKSSAELTLA
ncbi:MAG: hypothetical protein IJX26_01885, partial [Clostridia bacterium]|nr:hypothetical protein [Clostridia bacterium]